MCVCGCVYVLPRPKVGSKISFGVTCSFFLLKLWNLEYHRLYLISGVPFHSLMLLLVMVVVFVVAVVLK